MRKIFFLFFITFSVNAQDSLLVKKLEVRGYVKDLQSLTFFNDFNDLITGNLIHNRINLKWRPTGYFTGALELRNRLLWGEQVRMTPNFEASLRNPNERVNLSHAWISEESLILHTNIDRLWLEYHHDRWNLRLGRQRINWGIGTLWNPNDLFNTYNFLDFDYEERPGSDAVKFQYLTGPMSHVEVAIAPSENSEETIAALKYFINQWNYDFQFIGGLMEEQFTLGAGWSGSLQNTGFKGELQYFFANDSRKEQLNLNVEADRIFAKGWYGSIGFLFNSLGEERTTDNWNIYALDFSPKNLMPTRYNTLVSFSKEITPLFTAQASFIFTPGANLVLILPTLQYNIAQNMDVNLIWQSFLAEQGDRFEDLSHTGFIRFKYSF